MIISFFKDTFNLLCEGIENPLIIIITTILIVISSLISYVFKNPTKKEIQIYKNSLNIVYLPLKKIFFSYKRFDANISISSKVYIDLVENKSTIQNILFSDNFVYMFPELPEKLLELYNYIKASNEPKCEIPKEKLNSVVKQVSQDYANLKKKLGYPGMSILDIFIRKSSVDRSKAITYLVIKIVIIILYILLTFLYVLLIFGKINNMKNAIIFIVCVLSLIASIIILNALNNSIY